MAACFHIPDMRHVGNGLPGTKLSDFQITVKQQFLNVGSGGQKLYLTDFMTI